MADEKSGIVPVETVPLSDLEVYVLDECGTPFTGKLCLEMHPRLVVQSEQKEMRFCNTGNIMVNLSRAHQAIRPVLKIKQQTVDGNSHPNCGGIKPSPKQESSENREGKNKESDILVNSTHIKAEPNCDSVNDGNNPITESIEQGAPVPESGENLDREHDPVSKPTEDRSDQMQDQLPSSTYKIEIESLPQGMGRKTVEKLLRNKLKLKPHKTTFINKVDKVILTLRCEKEMDEALKAICDFVWNGQKLCAKKVIPVPVVRKRNAPLPQKTPVSLKMAKVDEQNQQSVADRVKNVTTPLWNMPYKEQLESKQDFMRKFMVQLTDNYSDQKDFPPLLIIPSSITTKYYNNYDFKIALHPDTQQPTVGFHVSSKCVGDASHCCSIPDIMCKAAEAFQEYIRASPLSIFTYPNLSGYWRQLTVRTTRKGHLLLIVIMHPQDLSKEQIECEKGKLRDYFSKSTLNVTSLYIQKLVKRKKKMNNAEVPQLQHVSGENFIEEELMGLNFRINPAAFFPTNTAGTELLYNTLREFANLTKKTTLLDPCCGTGTMAIAMAKHVLKVYGIASCNCDVKNASYNAKANGIENVEFVCAKPQGVLSKLIKESPKDSELVAILDPPDFKLGDKVIKALRREVRLKRVVFLSCNPHRSLVTLYGLFHSTASGNANAPPPFRPTRAVALDLFPQTTKSQLILLFERD